MFYLIKFKVNVTAICDNAYSGNYSLVIKSCTGENKDDEACDFDFEFEFVTVEKVLLPSVKTDRIANFNVHKMTMNISMQAISIYIFKSALLHIKY